MPAPGTPSHRAAAAGRWRCFVPRLPCGCPPGVPVSEARRRFPRHPLSVAKRRLRGRIEECNATAVGWQATEAKGSEPGKTGKRNSQGLLRVPAPGPGRGGDDDRCGSAERRDVLQSPMARGGQCLHLAWLLLCKTNCRKKKQFQYIPGRFPLQIWYLKVRCPHSSPNA